MFFVAVVMHRLREKEKEKKSRSKKKSSDSKATPVQNKEPQNLKSAEAPIPLSSAANLFGGSVLASSAAATLTAPSSANGIQGSSTMQSLFPLVASAATSSTFQSNVPDSNTLISSSSKNVYGDSSVPKYTPRNNVSVQCMLGFDQNDFMDLSLLLYSRFQFSVL